MKNHIRAAGIAGMGFALAAVHAQTVINNGSNNTTNVIVHRAPSVVIDRGPPTRPVTAAAAHRPPPPAHFPYQQRELLPYMTPRCAQLFDSQLTAGGGRSGHATRQDVREEFRLNCQDAVTEAQKALYQSRLKTYNVKQEAAAVSTMAAEQSRISREQCDELLRILAARRKRVAAMTDGERADHDRSESNYRARCTGR